MPWHKFFRKWFVYIAGLMVVSLVITVFSIQIRLVISRYKYPIPQSILVLGGEHSREPVAAQLASQHPNLEIWVSSGLLPAQANQVFLAENVSLSRVTLDYRATDTVTNFTTLVVQLQSKNVQHLYLITSDFHMPRAKAIAFWVLGSRGIAYTPINVPSDQPPEPYYKIFRDVVRSWLWLLTGRTGSSLDPNPPAHLS